MLKYIWWRGLHVALVISTISNTAWGMRICSHLIWRADWTWVGSPYLNNRDWSGGELSAQRDGLWSFTATSLLIDRLQKKAQHIGVGAATGMQVLSAPVSWWSKHHGYSQALGVGVWQPVVQQLFLVPHSQQLLSESWPRSYSETQQCWKDIFKMMFKPGLFFIS